MPAVAIQVAQLVQFVNVLYLRQILTVSHHEFLKQRAIFDLGINAQAADELMVDESVVDMGVVSAVELDKVSRDGVTLQEDGQRI